MNLNSLKVLYTSLAGRYAKALFYEGRRSSCLDEISENFDKLDTFFKNNQPIKKLLTSYCMNSKDTVNGWRALGDHLAFCPTFLAFMRQVIMNKRFNILNKIRYIFNVSFAKYKNKRNVVVSSAVELLPEQKVQIEKLIARAFDEKTIIKYKVNEKILGGIKISSEELLVDASVFSQLKQLSGFYKNLRLRTDEHED